MHEARIASLMVPPKLKSLVQQVPYIRRLLKERDRLLRDREQLLDQVQRLQSNQLYLPGHYYSAVPDVEELKMRDKEIFGDRPRALPGIDLNEAEQLNLLNQLKVYYSELPFTPQPAPDLRYYYENDYYCYSDAIFLYALLRHLQPKRLIEIGSGFSSAVTLDTNERFLNHRIACCFIEPFPDRLRTLLKPEDHERINILSVPLQDVPLSKFADLIAGDILFIDSTHVLKTGSDVNYLLFQILPSLATGVYVHFHDIFYPFEYLRDWVYEGRAWNEAYALRAFLQYNSAFKIVLFNTFLETFHTKFFEAEMPLCLKNWGGSLWLQKVA